MNLIANTGIQYYTVPLEIALDNNFKMYFHEWNDAAAEQQILEIAHCFTEDEVWVKKHDLDSLGYVKDGKVGRVFIDESGKRIPVTWETVKDAFERDGRKTIPVNAEDPRDSGCFQMLASRVNWDKIENVWFPLPFFLLNGSESEFGPTNWCRAKLIPVEITQNTKKYDLLLAFDTKSAFEDEDFEGEDLYETPVFTSNDKQKDYALCNNETKLIGYCSGAFNCDWVDRYLLKHFYGVEHIDDYLGPMPKMNYLAQYIYLVRYIQQLDILPVITLYSNKNAAYGKVDLVVDIGNSRTCAVLFDDGNFEKLSPLILQDLSNPVKEGKFEEMDFFGSNPSIKPKNIVKGGKVADGKEADYQQIKLNKHAESFDMRLAFNEASFGGNFGLVGSRQFIYPSMVRLGTEANRLIHMATDMSTGAEKISTFSSPKRYLWDKKPQKLEWEFVRLGGETAKPLYIEGISEQLNADGSLKTEGDGDILTRYSRRALMTFAFIEILAQAKMQINSYEQRSHWRDKDEIRPKPRRVGRIIVTSPAAMSRVEQIALRECARDAAVILDRFFKDTACAEVQVIPAPQKLKLSAEEERTEWIYDEATAAQFVFLYAEIGKRYRKNAGDYFDFYGKTRDDNYLGDYDKKSLTIGSVDIGAGTTDVMIAAYKYGGDSGQCTLTPVPLFWESFYEAGDDLLKNLIRRLVIDGEYSPVENKLRAMGVALNEIVDKKNDFFGDNNGMSSASKQMRSDFNLQVSVPVVSYFLELLKQNKEENLDLGFGDIFGGDPPTEAVLDYFEQHFDFRLESLQWQYRKEYVRKIVEQTFDSLIGKISSLLSYYACDIVLLSGRPTSLKPLSDLFLKYYAISPNRLKTMNDYRVGLWYPQDKRYKFIDGNGYFINPKSIVATGAMIGQIAESGGMNGFLLNLKELKDKLLPTTDYFGRLNEHLEFIETVISPEKKRAVIDVSFLPFRIGVRQLDISAYPSRPFYKLDFNDYKLEDRVKGRLDDEDDVVAVQEGVEAEKAKIRRGFPLKVTLERHGENKEELYLEDIVDKEGAPVSRNFVSLQVQSMSEEENFWLDSGIFPLSINNLH